ncbi:unnamed protein product [Sympodiomycopsis kandeliae]
MLRRRTSACHFPTPLIFRTFQDSNRSLQGHTTAHVYTEHSKCHHHLPRCHRTDVLKDAPHKTIFSSVVKFDLVSPKPAQGGTISLDEQLDWRQSRNQLDGATDHCKFYSVSLGFRRRSGRSPAKPERLLDPHVIFVDARLSRYHGGDYLAIWLFAAGFAIR